MGMRLCTQRYDNAKFVKVAMRLRVLNALRQVNIDVPFDEFKIDSILDHLLSKNHWPLATEVCKYLGVPVEEGVYKILAHWCLSLIEAYKENRHSTLTEEMLAQKIFDRLKHYPSISYADVAEVAARSKLLKLATALIEKETKISKQVAILLKLGETEKALVKALQSQQPDLVHCALRQMRETRSTRDIELFLANKQQVMSIYQSYLFDELPDRVLALYEQNDDFLRQAVYHLRKAEENYDFFDHTKLKEHLDKAEKALQMQRQQPITQLVSLSAQLIVENAKREETFSVGLTDKTLRETFIWAASNENVAVIELLKKQQRLSEKQVFQWTLEGLAQNSKWQQFESFVRSRKSPTGYLPVINICCRYKNFEMGRKFIDKIASYEEQINALLRIGEVKEAALLAAEKLDKGTLQNIRKKYPINSNLWVEVTRIMQDVVT